MLELVTQPTMAKIIRRLRNKGWLPAIGPSHSKFISHRPKLRRPLTLADRIIIVFTIMFFSYWLAVIFGVAHHPKAWGADRLYYDIAAVHQEQQERMVHPVEMSWQTEMTEKIEMAWRFYQADLERDWTDMGVMLADQRLANTIDLILFSYRDQIQRASDRARRYSLKMKIK